MTFLFGRFRAIRNRGCGLLAGAALALTASTSAFAQCVSSQGGLVVTNADQFAIPTTATSSAISSAIGNVNTAFLTQQGSAFVSAPANPAPDQPGGGVWARAVGGHADVKSNSASNVTGVAGGAVNTVATSCNNTQRSDFAGVQVGADIARLNWSGWNVHLGTTAGYLGSKSNDNFSFSNNIEVPYFGTYLVATNGRFFADLLVRQEFYNINLSNAGFTYFNQPIGAHGYSISASAGYNFDAGNGWFVEPSGGFIYSKTSVDNFINPGTPAITIPGLVSTNDVESEIGRLSLRVGKTIQTPTVVWQPFATASVFHEFAGDVITDYASLPNGAFFFPAGGGAAVPASITQTTATSRVGTYGQYSLGIAGQVVNTGWLGFLRVDYRNGDNIEGWTGNAGIRYQFTPETIASVMPTKAVKAPRVYVAPTSWTGFYVGGFAGAAGGRSDLGFVGDPTAGNKPWVAGGLGGIELGYNKQFDNNWVVGVEGDVGGSNIHGARIAGTADGLAATPAGAVSVGFSPALLTIQDRTNWMATITGRVGYAYARTLYYVKGGAAFEDGNVSTACIYGPTATLGAKQCLNQAGVATAGFSTPGYTRVGWTVGFGTEFDLGKNWSAKGEYDYLSFGRHTALASDGTSFLTDKSNISQVKVGVNYRFSPAAVIAKY